MAEQFLVESLLADALLLDEWGSRALPLAAPSQSEGARRRPMASAPTVSLEIRRQRNREFMQRARRRKKEEMDEMRRILAALTLRFEELCEDQQQHGPITVTSHTRRLRLESAYAALTETADRLLAEKVLLRRLIDQHDRHRGRLLETIKWLHETADEPKTVTCSLEEPRFVEYVDISLSRAQDAISDCYRAILDYERSAQPLAHWIVDASGPNMTFGWDISCEISTGNNFFLSMTKRLPGISANQAMQRTYAYLSKPRESDKAPTRRIAQSTLLQVLDHSTCVIANDWHHPLKRGVRMRSITVRSRLSTHSSGYAIGIGTLNPQDPEIRSHPPLDVEWMDRSEWHSFVDRADGCIVTIKMLTQYNTSEDLHLRLIHLLCFRWNWENDVIVRKSKQLMAL